MLMCNDILMEYIEAVQLTTLELIDFSVALGGREFVEVKEFSVPDTVRSMAWCGDNICLGIRREYVIMNSITGALSDIFPSGRSPPLVVSLPTGQLLLGKVKFESFFLKIAIVFYSLFLLRTINDHDKKCEYSTVALGHDLRIRIREASQQLVLVS